MITTKPVILLDHQPFHLDETAKYGIDLELSGHTHNGQIWPLNYVTGMIYELSSGYLKKNNTNFIVSSGYGLWGPRVRSGSRSEVLLINLTFNGTQAFRTDPFKEDRIFFRALFPVILLSGLFFLLMVLFSEIPASSSDLANAFVSCFSWKSF